MTTIVYSDGVLASDSLAVAGYQPLPGDEKKIFENSKFAVGFAGSVGQCLKVVKWILEDESSEELKPDLSIYEEFGVSLIIVSKDTLECWVIEDESLDLIPYNPPYAIGSGGICAMAALRTMKMLKKPLDAEMAIKIAMECDIYTGNKVKSINLKKKKKNKTKK